MMITDLERASERALPQNQRRVKHLAAVTGELKLISMYDNILAYLGESEDSNEDYEALEKLRVVWRSIEMKRIKSNLEKVQYQLKDADYVSLVLDGRRVEHVRKTYLYFLKFYPSQLIVIFTVPYNINISSPLPPHEDSQTCPYAGCFCHGVRRYARELELSVRCIPETTRCSGGSVAPATPGHRESSGVLQRWSFRGLV